MLCLSDTLLFQLSSGQCSPAERQAALAHVDECPGCRELLAAALPVDSRPSANLTPFALTQAAMRVGTLPLRNGDIVDGKYEVTGLLGAGGMGYVFDATQSSLERRVAIKVARSQDPELGRRFVREAKVSAQLKSDRIVRVLDAGILPNGSPFMVMERLEGESVSEWLAREGRLAPHEAIAIAIEVCRALREVHSRGIVHRDIKPSNLFRLKDGDEVSVKLLDFGIFKTLEGSSLTGVHDATASRAMMGLGSPRYMAPEQLRNSRELDERADQWALGATLFELLTGKAAFEGTTIADLCAEVLSGPTPKLEGMAPPLSTELNRILARCLAKAPEGRYDKIDHLLADLNEVAVLARSTTRARGPRRAQVWAASAFAATCIGALLALVLPRAQRAAERVPMASAVQINIPSSYVPRSSVAGPSVAVVASSVRSESGPSQPKSQAKVMNLQSTHPRASTPPQEPPVPAPAVERVAPPPQKVAVGEWDSNGLGSRK